MGGGMLAVCVLEFITAVVASLICCMTARVCCCHSQVKHTIKQTYWYVLFFGWYKAANTYLLFLCSQFKADRQTIDTNTPSHQQVVSIGIDMPQLTTQSTDQQTQGQWHDSKLFPCMLVKAWTKRIWYRCLIFYIYIQKGTRRWWSIKRTTRKMTTRKMT